MENVKKEIKYLIIQDWFLLSGATHKDEYITKPRDLNKQSQYF